MKLVTFTDVDTNLPLVFNALDFILAVPSSETGGETTFIFLRGVPTYTHIKEDALTVAQKVWGEPE